MMNTLPPDLGENHLLAQLIRALTLIAIVITLSLASCQMHAQYRMAQALGRGADPVGAACMFTQEREACALAAARRSP